MTERPRLRLRRITHGYPRPVPARSDLALTSAATDVALRLLDELDETLGRIAALPDTALGGDASAILLRISGSVTTAALQLDELGRKVTAPELADAPVMERAVAT